MKNRLDKVEDRNYYYLVKMKKLSPLFLAVIIMLAHVGSAEAFVRPDISGKSLMSFDARDTVNRKAPSFSMALEETTFSRFFAIFSPVGNYRFSGGKEETGIYNKSSFTLPYVVATISTTEKNNLLTSVSTGLYYASPFGGLLVTLLLLTVLLYRERLQTTKEPRFLLPILLE